MAAIKAEIAKVMLGFHLQRVKGNVFRAEVGGRGRSAAKDPEHDAPGPHFVRPRPPVIN